MNINPDDDVAANQAFSQEVAQAPTSIEEPPTDKAVKRRTWKKPKDKPKRPLSSYNIFFQHKRSRIVDGYTKDATPEEIIRSIEGILCKSREKRRHRKTHGRISFGDLARTIADQWKTIDPQSRAIFDHYAEVDMRRYRKEVKSWRDKKEREGEAASLAGLERQRQALFMQSMNSSASSVDSTESDFNLEQLPQDSNADSKTEEECQPRKGYDSFSSSFSSIDSGESDFCFEPVPIRNMVVQKRAAATTTTTNRSDEDTKPAHVGSDHLSASMQAFAPMRSSFGHSSMGSLQPGDPLLGFVPSEVPRERTSQSSGQASNAWGTLSSNLSSSYASGLQASHSSQSSAFNTSVGLFPPSTISESMSPNHGGAYFDPNQYHSMFAQPAPNSSELERFLGSMELDRRSGSGRGNRNT